MFHVTFFYHEIFSLQCSIDSKQPGGYTACPSATIAVYLSLIAVVLLITLINPRYLPETPTSTTVTADEDQPLGWRRYASFILLPQVPFRSFRHGWIPPLLYRRSGCTTAGLRCGISSTAADASAGLQAPSVAGLTSPDTSWTRKSADCQFPNQAVLQSNRMNRLLKPVPTIRAIFELKHPGVPLLFHSTANIGFLRPSGISASDRDIVHNFIHSKAGCICRTVIDKKPTAGFRRVVIPSLRKSNRDRSLPEPPLTLKDALPWKLADFFRIQISAEGYVSYNPVKYHH